MAAYPVLDSDSHIRETADDYRSRIPEEFRRIRQGIFPSDCWDRFLGRMGKQTIGTDGYVEDMDVEGIQLTVTYPTMGLNLCLVPQSDLQKALARAWNDYIGEIQQQNPRMKGVATVSLKDVPAAVEELNRAVTKWRHPGVMIHTHGHKKNLGAEEFWPLYAEAERLGIPVCFHGNSWGAEGQDRWETFLQAHTVSFSFEIMQAFLGVLTSGVLERFQNLKVGFFEAGCGWLPYWLDRIDEHYERRSGGSAVAQGQAQRVRGRRPGVRELRPGRRHAALLHGPLRRRHVAVRRGLPPLGHHLAQRHPRSPRTHRHLGRPEAQSLLRQLQPLLRPGAGGVSGGTSCVSRGRSTAALLAHGESKETLNNCPRSS